MRIGVPKEIHPQETRVAATPETVAQLRKLGFEVAIEAGAGVSANFPDAVFAEQGASIVQNTKDLWAQADIILKVLAPEEHPTLQVHEVDLLTEGATLISFIWPAQNKELLDRLVARKATVLAMDCVPRISRAQKLDALSSMANIAGYRAVVEAANCFGRFFTGQVTAAGKIPPAKILVIGAGVAGLAALGVANNLGAIVRAFDTRPEVKEQIESMGAEFLEVNIKEEGSGTGGYAKVMSPEFIKAEMELFAKQAQEVDIIITTAQIPGKKAPVLITEDMVKSMRPGSVVVDLAASQGGNCEVTEPGESVIKHGVHVIGYSALPTRLPTQASQLYGTNIRHLLSDLCPNKDGIIQVDMEDDVIRGTTVIKNGEITWPPPPPKIQAIAVHKSASTATPLSATEPKKSSGMGLAIAVTITIILMAAIGWAAPPEFMSHFTVFVLSCFVGYLVVSNVIPALFTPLMSLSNALSGVVVVGALLLVSSENPLIQILAAAGTVIAAINAFGGFFVTQRMLRMFKK
ncbi:NAD(P) transhydrogenase subunit alpha [Achromatium sp. WMS1]|nr:NAD(P) transhydrogenase subunit alpha [Achromatium sp. WMS1]